MKRLVVCSDGTWQRPDQVIRGRPDASNVVRLWRRIAKQDGNVAQVSLYDPGVGTGNLVDRLLGGAFGTGLEQNILEAYRFLVSNYVQGDELFLFGFSRGAYTVRSLAGMIRKCGIVRDQALSAQAMKLYRDPQHPDDPGPTQFREANAVDKASTVPIKFIGVWDTVGARGIPIGPLSIITRDKYKFHDTRLSGSVQFAYQALAIDEHRGPFVPTLWSWPAKAGQTLEQVWFSGQHSDIGGGSGSAGLPDITLQWMLGKARAAGLAIDAAIDASDPVRPNPHARFNILEGLPLMDLFEFQRKPGLDEHGNVDPTQSVDASVQQRWDSSDIYRPAALRAYFKRAGDARSESSYPPAMNWLSRLRASFGA